MMRLKDWLTPAAHREATRFRILWTRATSPHEAQLLLFTIVAGFIIGAVFGQIARLPL